MARRHLLSPLSPMVDIADGLYRSRSLDQVSESKGLKLALKTKTYMPFLLWDLEEGEAWV